MLVFATLAARPRRWPRGRAASRPSGTELAPEPAQVATGRATMIHTARPLGDEAAGRDWLGEAGERELAEALAVLNRALQAYRLATADPHLPSVGRDRLLVARLGFGGGEQVADGNWTMAKQLTAPRPRERRRGAGRLSAQGDFAAVLSARTPALACQELTLRARLDLDQGRPREAALQLQTALDAALAELPRDPHGAELGERLAELRRLRESVTAAASAALAGTMGEDDAAAVSAAIARLEAALRARAAAAR